MILAPHLKQRFYDNNNNPLNKGLLFCYVAGTSTKQTTYSDSAGTPNTNPIVLNFRGECDLWLDTTKTYKFVLAPAADTDPPTNPFWSVDNVAGGYTGTILSTQIYYAITAAETAAGVTVVNFYIPNHLAIGAVIPDRYATNTTPGTTDMTAAIVAALAVAAQGPGKVLLYGTTYLTGNIDWPANNLTLQGASDCFSADTSGTPRTVLKAKTATTIVLDLVQTGISVDRQGNHICDLEIDGNSIAAVGIDSKLNNIIERVSVKGTTAAGFRLGNLTNGTIIRNCKGNNNSGWGLLAEGASTTPYEIIQSRFSSNTLGGVDLEAGVGVRMVSCIIESNGGTALKINRPVGHNGGFLDFIFEKVWLEDNASNSPFFTLVINSDVAGFANYPAKIHFKNCRLNTGSSTRKHMNIGNAAWVTFEECNFDASTQSDALTLSTSSTYVAFINSATASNFTGLSATQIDNAIAQGTRCYSSDIDIIRTVGAGSPAAAFANSWVNFGAPYESAGYWFDTDGNVHLCGAIKSGTITNSAFTLPVGYRPSGTIDIAVDSNGAYGLLRITSAGAVTPQVGSNSIFNLDGVMFSTK